MASINGGAGNNYIYSNGHQVTINTANGNDTIKLGASIQSLAVEGFNAGDIIELATSTTNLETINGGIKAGNITISGINNVFTINNSWSTSANNITYNQSTVAGAKINDTKITYDTTAGSETLFTLTGAKSTEDIKVDKTNKIVTLNGNVAYLKGGTGEYYSLSEDSVSVTYNASVAGSSKIELSGVKGTPTLSGTTVKLTTDNFASNVNVKSNAGSYKLNLSGDFEGKSFTGTASADSITNVGKNISLIGGAGNDKITNTGLNVTIKGGTGNDTLLGSTGDDKLLGGSGNDSLSGGDGKDTLSGNAGDDKLLGGSGNDLLSGGDGKDTLSGGTGDDTLEGGKGNDIFVYDYGNDVITDYATGDKISLSTAISNSKIKKSDAILTFDGNSLTIKDGKFKKLTLIDSKGKEFTTVVGGITYNNSSKSKISIASDIFIADASKRTNGIAITGNNLGNVILGSSARDVIFGANGNDSLVGNKGSDSLSGGTGNDTLICGTGNDTLRGDTGNDKLFGEAGNDVLYGGTGNDTLWGGKGNDTLRGDTGSDTFIYTSGDDKDIIYGFANNDLLQITGVFSTSYNKSKKEISFKVDSTAGAITLKNFSASSFNINNVSYKISNSKLIKK